MGDDTDNEDSPLPMSSSESQSQSQAQTSLTLWGDQEPQSQSLLSPMSSPPTPAQTRRPPLHSRQTTLDGFGTSAAAGTSRSRPSTIRLRAETQAQDSIPSRSSSTRSTTTPPERPAASGGTQQGRLGTSTWDVRLCLDRLVLESLHGNSNQSLYHSQLQLYFKLEVLKVSFIFLPIVTPNHVDNKLQPRGPG